MATRDYPDLDSVVYRTENPVWEKIPGSGLKPGSLIIVHGRVLPDAKKLEFNLVSGDLVTVQVIKNGDIGFHFNPRFDQNCVVRNTRQKGVWGPEERDPKYMPFQLGRQFEMMILVEQTTLKVAIDGKHFIDYKHRLPFTSLKIFNVEGDISIERLEFRLEAPLQAGNVLPQIGFEPGVLAPIFNPAIPLYLPLVGGVKPGMMIYFSGKPTLSADLFVIEFVKASLRTSEHAETHIAFHFNPRLQERVVVRNSLIAGAWGEEERSAPNFPFAVGVNFDLIIRPEGNRWLVAVNGQHFIEFYHRVQPLNEIDMLRVRGDVSITSIRFSQ